MRYLSLFSGIEAATVAWHQLGWTPVAFAEIEPGPCSVLKHHYPAVPNLGDVTCITDAQIAALGRIDVVIGGSPCQDLSVAGKRAGLAGARSSLFHEQLRIFNAARHLCGARWLVWENVPGAFSSNAGRDFAVVVGAMAGLELAPPRDGWGNEGMAVGENGLVEWCVLDAQWFGLAQRRKRVFAVLDTGDWANRPPVLLEPDRLRGDFAPRREAGQGSSVDTLGGTSSGGGWRIGADEAAAGHLIPETTHTLRADGFDASEDGTGRGTPLIPETCGALTDGAHNGGGLNGQDAYTGRIIPAPVIAFDCKSSGQSGFGVGEIASTLRSMGHADSHQSGGGHLAVAERGMQVRRLTPRECERLQGFMADYTLVPHNGKPLADGPRYKALGNSMATPVIAWIGRQIERVAQA